jgi:serine protease AprX
MLSQNAMSGKTSFLSPWAYCARFRSSVSLGLLAALSLSIVAASPVQAGDPLAEKADRFLRAEAARGQRDGWVSVIVTFREEAGAAALPSDKQKAALRPLRASIYRHLPIIQAAALRIPRKNLPQLAALPFVTRLSADSTVKKTDDFILESSVARPAYQQYGVSGRGVTVAVIDSGIRNHPDLSVGGGSVSRIRYSKSFLDNEWSSDDFCGHGTHIAGIIGGNGEMSSGFLFTQTFYGVARDVSLVNLRVLDRNGTGEVSNVAAALQWAIQNRNSHGIRVINLSLGHPVGESYTTDPLCKAVEAAWKAGIVVVCAAGNGGRQYNTVAASRTNEGYGTAYGTIQSPANSPYVITVGAMKQGTSGRNSDRIATYSSRGPTPVDYVAKPDLVAAGNRIASLYSFGSALYVWNTSSGNGLPLRDYTILPWDIASPHYIYLSGSSMAAPVVTGAVALLLEEEPTLSPDSIKARLMLTADKWKYPNGQTDAMTFGAGYLNINSALGSGIEATRFALSPTIFKAGTQIKINLSGIVGLDGLWGTGQVGGTQVLWGGDAVTPGLTLTPIPELNFSDVWRNQVLWGGHETTVDLSSLVIYGEN